MRRDRLALNTVSLRADSFERLLSAIAAAGFGAVEFRWTTVKEWLAAGHSVHDLKELLGRLDLRCTGGFEAPVNCFGDPAARTANRDLLIGNAELLDRLGGGTMVVGTDGPETPGIEALDTVGAALRELAERIPETVSLALEFNWSPLVKSLRSAARAEAAADHPRVGILFDPAHYHCTSSKLEDLTPQVIQAIHHVHVDDMRNKPGELSQCNADRELPGEGCLDLRGILARIEAGGYTGWFSIEMFSDALWSLPPEDAAARMYRALAGLCED